VLTGPEARQFLPAFLAFQRRVARAGLTNSLAQTVLKIGSPGVPDFYQGTDLWDLSLVDPDNRRPVDFDLRARMLDRVDDVLAHPRGERRKAIRGLMNEWQDGAIKLLVATCGLRRRAAAPALFLEGEYLPLEVDVTVSAGLVAFARVLGATDDAPAGRAALVIAPHLALRVIDDQHPVPIGDVWKTSRVLLPPALGALTYREAFTGTELKPASAGGDHWIFAGQALQTLPVALLIA
jgi:(1->4)-alpha-D-glucan 1-alpha-D-glucosylmutase